MTKIIRISETAYKKLVHLEKISKNTKQEVIDKALEQMIRDNLLARANEAFRAYDAEDRKELEEWERASLQDLPKDL